MRGERLLVIAVFVLTFGASCRGSEGGTPWFPVDRGVSLHVSAVDDANERSGRRIEGPAPLAIAARLGHANADRDKDVEIDIVKAEIDFGDGSGWQDCTADFNTKWYREPYVPDQQPLAWMTPHTYMQPGTYRITGRLTYWDGEVLTTDDGEAYPVAVLP